MNFNVTLRGLSADWFYSEVMSVFPAAGLGVSMGLNMLVLI